MWKVCAVWSVLLLIAQIVCLVKSVKTKNNKNWCTLFAVVGFSIISASLVCGCVGWNWETLSVFLIGVAAIFVYVIMLLISIIMKVREVIKYKKSNIVREKADKKALRRSIVIPLLIIVLPSVILCAADYTVSVVQKKQETKKYNEIKQAETEKMARFVNNKYGLSFDSADCVYYREEDYNYYAPILDGGITSDTPYIAVFENENQRITVADRNGVISDNGQLKDINYYVGDYFSDVAGIDIEYVQITKTTNGNIADDTINSVLQNGFNQKITQYNIRDFMSEVYKEDNLKLEFYAKESGNSAELVQTLASKLGYLEKYENINRIDIYIYDKDEDLLVYNRGTDLDEEVFEEGDSYKYFDYYFVVNDSSYIPSGENSRFKIDEINTFVDYTSIVFRNY